MKKDIAIIGMAGRFPLADDLDQLAANLREGRDCVSFVTPKRIKETTLDPKRECMPCGYLDDIDKFDHHLFDISLGEAQTMGPNQRLLLMTAYEAIENAAYNVDDLRDRNACVFVSQSDSFYYQHADETVPTLISGNSPDFLAPRVSRQFGLTGTATMVDTACSSSLTALHLACNELLLGSAEMAFVCGVNIHIFPYKNSAQGILDVWAPDGKSRAFSANAQGMSAGEMAACVLLKPLDTALKDGDVIHAVIKSVAVNNNAGHSSSPSAPDSSSHARVMMAAWEKAGIDPRQIRFVEAHGSGTQLGDSLEVEGFNKAFKSYTDQTRFCAISTIKSNVGHGKSAAGMSGLLKTALSLKLQTLFPAVHFDEPNPLIDFENSAVYVHDRCSPWDRQDGRPRLGGVHSFGLSGVNGHAVLQEAPERASVPAGEASPGPYLMAVSSKSPQGLGENIRALYRNLAAKPTFDLADVSFTLTRGRKHYPVRFACLAESRETFLETLKGAGIEDFRETKALSNPEKIIFIFSDHEVPEQWLSRFATCHPAFEQAYQHCLDLGGDPHANLRDFAFQYAFYRLLEAHDITTTQFLSVGIGKWVAEVLDGTRDLAEALRMVVDVPKTPLQGLSQRVSALIEREVGSGRTAFLAMAPACPLTRELKEQTGADSSFFALAPPIPQGDENPYLTWLLELYLAHGLFSWDGVHNGVEGRRISLPGYQFAKTRCWLREEPKPEVDRSTQTAEKAAALPVLKEAGSPLQKQIALLWRQTLEMDCFSLADDFFDVGGDSLKASKVISLLNREFDLELSFEDIFDFPTIGGLARYVDGLWGTEAKLAKIWRDVLKVNAARSDDDFFRLGGHSLLANQVILRIEKYFELKLNFEDIFKYPTLGALAGRVEQLIEEKEAPVAGGEIPLAAAAESYPVSPSQKRLWVLCRLGDASLAYNLPVFDLLRGDLDLDALEKALHGMVARHESLRTVFVAVDGQPRQKVLEPKELAFQPRFLDLSDHDDPESEARRLITQDATESFSLHQGPLFKVRIMRIDTDAHVFLLNIHHIIADDWSVKVFFKELLTLYQSIRNGAPSPLPPLPLQYKDYSAWLDQQLRTPAYLEHERYWLDKLGGERPLLNLPTDRIRPAVQSFNGRVFSMQLEPNLTAAFEAACREHGATLFMGLVTVVNAVFYKYTGQTDILLGSPIAGRAHPSLEGQIGFYANTLVLRNQFKADHRLETLLAGAKQTLIEASEHQVVPFDRLVDQLKPKRDLSRSVLFDVLLILQNSTVDVSEGFGGQGLAVSSFESEHTLSKLDLTLEFSVLKGGLQGRIEYNVDLFDPARIEAMAGHMERIVTQLTEDVGTVLQHVEILSDAERRRCLEEWNPEPVERATLPVHRWVARQSRKYPKGPALFAGGAATNYETLMDEAGQLAMVLREHGVALETPVALCVERERHLVVGMLGILMAGGCYLPLDPASPASRAAYILEDAGVALTLVDRHTQALIPETLTTLSLDPLDRDGRSKQFSQVPVDLANLAYVIYTSGSTGKPKGVSISHRALTNLLGAMKYQTAMTRDDVFLAVTTLSFDIASLEIFLPLVSAALLILADRTTCGDGVGLAELIDRHGVTAMQATPATWRLMPESWWQATSTMKIICGGEALPGSLARRLMKKTDRAWNVYGPTESTIWSSVFPLKPEQAPPEEALTAIGRPLDNTRMVVLDDMGNLVPPGIPGALYIGGHGLGRGYVNRPGLTASVFLPDPFSGNRGSRLYCTGDVARFHFDGNLEFLDRIDHQVKIRGFRIEPGEIEAVLATHPKVREAAVIACRDTRGSSDSGQGEAPSGISGAGEKRLVAYVAGEDPLTTSELVRFLKGRLPEYMVPSVFVTLNLMPHTANGKIDRKALPQPEGDRPSLEQAYVQPKSGLERTIAHIWKDILQLEKVGVHDNYFELGGDSLLLIGTMDRVNRDLEVDLSLIEMFQYPTIASLVDHLKHKQDGSESLLQSAERVAIRRGRQAAIKQRKDRRKEVARQLG